MFLWPQRSRRPLRPPVLASASHCLSPTATNATWCTTCSRVTPGPTHGTTASCYTGNWRRCTAEPRWSSSETSTAPGITTCGSASPGTATVRHREIDWVRDERGREAPPPVTLTLCVSSWLGLERRVISGLCKLGTWGAQRGLPPRGGDGRELCGDEIWRELERQQLPGETGLRVSTPSVYVRVSFSLCWFLLISLWRLLLFSLCLSRPLNRWERQCGHPHLRPHT